MNLIKLEKNAIIEYSKLDEIATVTKLRRLKQFMKDEGIKYE